MCESAPAPDPGIGQAAKANAEVAKEALEYYKAKDAAAQPRQDKMDALATKLADQQIESSAENTRQGKELYDRYTKVGIPAEDAMYRDAAQYDSPDRIDREVGKAGTDVDMAMQQQNDAKMRAQERAGVNPADGRALSLQQDAATTGALAKAGAMNSTRGRIQDMGIMLRKDAAGFAKGMPGTAASVYGAAGAAGAGATGAIGGAIQSANNTTQANGAGFGTAINGNASAGSILNQEYGNDVSAASHSGLAGAVGGLAQGIGAAGGVSAYFSDEEMKEGKGAVDPDAALEGIEKTKVQSWRYKKGSAGDDGGQQHIGAMAQDMRKNLGEAVAPGGKMVDTISAIGVNMAATKALAVATKGLAKRVDKLQATVAKGTRA